MIPDRPVPWSTFVPDLWRLYWHVHAVLLEFDLRPVACTLHEDGEERMRSVAAVILAGGQGERLSVLSAQRAKPAVPFAGKYRIIDFALSNCVNSGIYRCRGADPVPAALAERPHRHRPPWDLDRSAAACAAAAVSGSRARDWYRGTADAIYQNLSTRGDARDHVLILSGDHVYKMDYDRCSQFHRGSGRRRHRRRHAGADGRGAPLRHAGHRRDGRVIGFDEKPAKPRSNLIDGHLRLQPRHLRRRLEEDARRGSMRDFGRDIIPRMVDDDRVYAYRFDGYWRDVGTIQSYWEVEHGAAQRAARLRPVRLRLGHPHALRGAPARRDDGRAHVVTQPDLARLHHQRHGRALGALTGRVRRRGRGRARQHHVTDSIVGPGSEVDHGIMDKNVVVGAAFAWASATTAPPNRTQPRNLNRASRWSARARASRPACGSGATA